MPIRDDPVAIAEFGFLGQGFWVGKPREHVVSQFGCDRWGIVTDANDNPAMTTAVDRVSFRLDQNAWLKIGWRCR